jgi:TPR repeat protein
MIKGPIGKILPPEMEGTGLPGNPPDQLRLPTLDERAKLYLRAIHGERDFADQEHSAARDRLLDEMADSIAPQSTGHSGDSDLPWTPEGSDFDRVVVAAASFRIPDEYLREFESSPETPADSVGYSASEEPPAVVKALRDDALSVRASLRAYSPREGTEFDATLASIALSRISSRRQLAAKSRWRPVAKRQMFRAAAAIAATVLLVAGAYRLALLPADQTASESRVAAQIPPPPPRPPTLRSSEELGSVVPASQGPYTTVMRGPSTPTIASPDAPGKVDATADKVQRGQALTASGQILAARFVLKEAADANSAEAALALGMTYDPMELENLGVRNVLPEPDTARHWYQKAKDLGSTEAQGRLDKLAAREDQLH